MAFKYTEEDILDLMAMFSIKMCEEELSDENIALAKREARKFLVMRNKKIKESGHRNKTILGNGISRANKKRARGGR
jgi:hypothetical protein